MSKKTLNKGRIRFKKASALLITPYMRNSDGDYILGDTTYDVVDIVADSVSIEQADSSTESKNSEFSDGSLFDNTTLGEWTFNATCIDFQNDIMRSLYGCTIGKSPSSGSQEVEVSGAIAFPDEAEDLYCMIQIQFSDASTPDVYIPKVLMNSKAAIGTLRTGSAEGVIQGTAKNCRFIAYANITSSGTSAMKALNFQRQGQPKNYEPTAPLVYLPKSYRIAVINVALSNSDNRRYTVEESGETVSVDQNGIVSMVNNA